jgi:hypothetical protein
VGKWKAERLPRTVCVKKSCCGDSPRCKRCPAVWKRLGDADLAERVGRREWKPLRARLTDAVLARARVRG